MTDEREKPTRRHRSKGPISAFREVEEAAQVWDTHDSVRFEPEFEDAADVQFVSAKPKRAITIWLKDDSLAALSKDARTKDLGHFTLVRMWIVERLQRERSLKR